MTEAQTHIALLEGLKDATESVDWTEHATVIQSDVSPWVHRLLSLAAPEKHAVLLKQIVEDILFDVQDSPTMSLTHVLVAFGVGLRLEAMDRWLMATTKQTLQNNNREMFQAQATEMVAALDRMKEDLDRRYLGIRALFSDQWSEMHLDLEYLLTGLVGSRRLQHASKSVKQEQAGL